MLKRTASTSPCLFITCKSDFKSTNTAHFITHFEFYYRCLLAFFVTFFFPCISFRFDGLVSNTYITLRDTVTAIDFWQELNNYVTKINPTPSITSNGLWTERFSFWKVETAGVCGFWTRTHDFEILFWHTNRRRKKRLKFFSCSRNSTFFCFQLKF